MKFINKIWIFFFLLTSTIVLGQTPGFNYQALILNNVEVQIPGTDVTDNKIPLVQDEIILRFTIRNDSDIEYIEEHEITTDENGMVSIIVGEGNPIENTFQNINWNGKIKFLDVELNIISNNDGFVALDTKKIMYIPHPSQANVKIVNMIQEINPPYNIGDLIWVTSFGPNNNPTLLIFDGDNWVPVNNDYDNTNELGLIVVSGLAERSNKFPEPVTGSQVWNKTCQCIQVFDNNSWVSIITKANNGVSLVNDTIKLGGNLIEPTRITTNTSNTLSILGLESSNNIKDKIIVANAEDGVLKQRSISSLTLKKEQIIYAIEGQIEFLTPLNITNADKINVYRNGVNISFTVINNTTIKLEPEAICYLNDKIRIVQLY